MAKKYTQIISVLLEKQGEDINISRIAKYSGIDYKNTYMSIKDLEKQGILTLSSFGKTIKVILNKKVHPLIFEAEFERRKNLLKNKDFLVITNRLSELNFPFITLLFGSHAKGKAIKHSDIDLLVVCEEKKESIIQEIFDLFPLKIHPTFTTFEDFIKMLKTKEFNVVLEAVKNNIILIGIEDYYRLLENVG